MSNLTEEVGRLLRMPQQKPEYVFQPLQVLRTLARRRSRPETYVVVTLPWGVPLRIRPSDNIGRAIWRTGIYDLPLTEAILRLASPGETAVDVGANIGLMTAAMATAVGKRGRVFSFEPLPELFDELGDNVNRWLGELGWSHVCTDASALSNRDGVASLRVPTSFAANRGTATLRASAEEHDVVTVSVRTLDGALEGVERVGVLKVDVEGHELQVFEGAQRLLEAGRVRDILFEDYHPYPSPVTERLSSLGYEIRSVRKGLLGPKLLLPGGNHFDPSFELPNYLATRDLQRATAKFAPIGWRALRQQGVGQLTDGG
ncbi:MAG: FkbM family methyltransferase [Actinomycetota bacterium]|nr:FkbM family methyltransferase [Actinomycetota bacterium]